jgi:cellulose synthase/poly-beta-1,6-N-acetylglucosamine synthase-like glycosyltransferase
VLELIFWASCLLVGYSYFGYLAWLLLRARLAPAPEVERRPIRPAVTVLVVAHNEAGRIGARVLNCLALDYPADRLEVLVASDGSTDATDEIVTGYAARGVRLLSLPGPRGKASALNAAVPECRGEVVVLADARQRFAPDAVRELVEAFADPAVGAVSGELHIESPAGSPEGVGVYWRYEKLIRSAESRVGSVVGATGAIYAIRRSLFRPLAPETILDDVVIPLRIANAGYRVLFEPRARAFDRLFDESGREFRRKVRTLAGNYQLVALDPSLLDPRRNRLFWPLVSHKLTRLVVPWCLAAMLGASGALALHGSGFYALAFAAQAAFYLLALVAWPLSRAGRRVRLFSVPYALVLLNLAAAAALFGFLRGTQRVTWKSAS